MAVCCPFGRAGLAWPELHSAPLPVAVAFATASPSALLPLKIWTVTCVLSLPKPLKDGVVFLEGDSIGFRVTVGEEVSTSKLTVLLLPSGFPSELFCVAIAVY